MNWTSAGVYIPPRQHGISPRAVASIIWRSAVMLAGGVALGIILSVWTAGFTLALVVADECLRIAWAG